MGKIRVKTLGDEELEKEQKKDAKKRKEEKKIKISAAASDEVNVSEKAEETSPVETKTEKPGKEKKAAKKYENKKESKSSRSRKYKTVFALVDRTKTYALSEALELLPKLKITNFDETVELHVNTIEAGISGNVTLPHGSGKQVRVAIADDALIAIIEKGKIEFDVLLAEPQMMPKLARVAKILGPRGLMPNPKNGTVTQNPKESLKKYEGGHMSFKTEAKLPVIHITVGKVSFGEKKLSENIVAILNAVQKSKIRNVTLKSTMSPGIKLQV